MSYYKTTKLNQLFKIWGIILWVLGAISCLISVIASIVCIVAGIKASNSYMNRLASYMGYDIAGYAIVIGLILLLMSILGGVYRYYLGKSLYVDRFTTPGARIVFAVLSFLGAFGEFIYAILLIKEGDDGIIVGLLLILCMAMDITTGVLFILKYKYIAPDDGRVLNESPHIPSSYSNNQAQIPSSYSNNQPQIPSSYSNDQPQIPVQQPAHSHGAVKGLSGQFNGCKLPMTGGSICTIGRDSSCNIRLQHPKVSRLHCEIRYMGNGKYIVTDRSSNGTYANNQRLQNGVPVKVKSGTLLVIGNPDNVFKLK